MEQTVDTYDGDLQKKNSSTPALRHSTETQIESWSVVNCYFRRKVRKHPHQCGHIHCFTDKLHCV